MQRLIQFELDKIWHKRSFLLAVCVLWILNVFLLWYNESGGGFVFVRKLGFDEKQSSNEVGWNTNLSDYEKPPLSAYRAFQDTIKDMTETEKGDYLLERKEIIDGVCLVRDVLMLQAMKNEMGTVLAEQALAEHPDVFERYFEVYQNGTYLTFTNSLEQEEIFLNELYAEQQETAGYSEYLQSIQDNKDVLSGISIFGNQEDTTFSIRNIEKSAKDYLTLSNQRIRWMPSKALELSMEGIWTDVFLLLSVFLFAGNLIFEEKVKQLFLITRCTKYGYVQSITAKLIALLIHCMVSSCLLYGTNIVFAEVTIGFGDITAGIQSVAAYMESNLSISILEYMLLSVFTKGMILFGIGAILVALCIAADNILFPYITGFLLCGISYILYLLMPAVGAGSLFKYLNLIGLLKTEQLYGTYFNFNIFEYPVSRLGISWLMILLMMGVGVLAGILLFVYGNQFRLRNRQVVSLLPFRLHASLLRYEGYKILITNRAAIILFAFGLLIGYRILSRQYHPSVQEQYYQNIMLQLEGELTVEKEAIIMTEQDRYDEAFGRLEQIDRMVSNGELSEAVGESLKTQWYAVTAFYPAFERVMQQYQSICENGGCFIYDTGYLYLFGNMDQELLMDLLLLSLCIVFAFSNVIAMEEQSGTWSLLRTTRQGVWNIVFRKVLVCVIMVVLLAFIPMICRVIRISSVYPLHGTWFSVNDIPWYRETPVSVSIGFFGMLLMLSQILSLIAVTFLVLAISYWRKNHIQAIFFSILVLVVPLVLRLLGFAFAEWLSVYPFYAWTSELFIVF